MKKSNVVFIFLVSFLVLVGCSSNNNNSNNDKKEEKKEEKDSRITKYEVLEEMNVEETPVDVDNKGFIMKQDGAYTFLFKDGTKFDPGFTAKSYLIFLSDEGQRVCFYDGNGKGIDIDNQECGPTGSEAGTNSIAWIDNEAMIKMNRDLEASTSESLKKFVEANPDFLNHYEGKYFMEYNNFSGDIRDQNIAVPVVITNRLLDRVNDQVYSNFVFLSAPMDTNFNRLYEGVRDLKKLNAVEKDGKWALLDQEANIISKFEYTKVIPISNSFMRVDLDGKVGVVDTNGKLVLFGSFEDVLGIIDGKAFIKKDGKWFHIKIS